MGTQSTGKRGQRGITLVMTALFLFVLLAMAAIAIDLGIAYTVRTGAQHAADAAALAGAFAFRNDPGMSDGEIQQAAVKVANLNNVLGKPVAITTSDVTVNRALQRVTVTFTGDRLDSAVRQTYFARAMGWNSFNIRVTATAEAAPSAGATRCLKPFYIPNTALAYDETPEVACSSGHVLIGDDSKLTTWAKNKLSAEDNLLGFWTKDSNKSHWDEIKFVSKSTGPVLRCTIMNCLNDCSAEYGIASEVACGKMLDTNQGAKTDPAAGELKDLIGQPLQDVYVSRGLYQQRNSGGPIGDPVTTSKSLMTVAVYDNCTGGTLKPGATQVEVTGYAQIFVEYVVANGQDKDQIPEGDKTSLGAAQKAVKSRLVDVSECGGSPTGLGSGAAVPIRLVHPN